MGPRHFWSAPGQSSWAGPLLYLCVYNIDDELLRKISKFVDDETLCHAAWRERNRLLIPQDLKKLIECPEAGQMLFIVPKCIVTRMGGYNSNFNYTVAVADLAAVNQRRDLDVLI